VRLIGVYGCEGVGQSSSFVVFDITVVSVVDMGFPFQISGPPRGWRSAAIGVAMLRAILEGHGGLPPREV
jgi:hypothetical protein